MSLEEAAKKCEHCGETLNKYGECPHYDECSECGLMACGFDNHECQG